MGSTATVGSWQNSPETLLPSIGILFEFHVYLPNLFSVAQLLKKPTVIAHVQTFPSIQ